jgi:hypothetical protein
MITITFNVNKADVLAMTQQYYASSATARKSRLINQVSVPIVMIVIAVLVSFRDPHYLLQASPFLLMAVIWIIVYPRIHRWYLLQAAEKMLNESAYEKAFGAYTMNLSETGIVSASPI